MMESNKKLNILFIDDKWDSQLKNTVEYLREELGHEVDATKTPEEGIKKASHYYDVIFVDFDFGATAKYDGADIGLILRQEYPLVRLILLTAFGKEHIADFCYVGFDTYLEKAESKTPPMKWGLKLQESLNRSRVNAQKRIKTEFSQEECDRVKFRMDCLENVLKVNKKNRSYKLLAPKVLECEREKGSTQKSLSGNALNEFFQIRSKKINGLCENALILRYLFKNNLFPWEEAMNYKPIDKIIKEYNL